MASPNRLAPRVQQRIETDVPVSPASPATQPASPASPATQPASPASPATQPASPASPATQPASPASPATQPASPASPATRQVSQASPASTPPRSPQQKQRLIDGITALSEATEFTEAFKDPCCSMMAFSTSTRLNSLHWAASKPLARWWSLQRDGLQHLHQAELLALGSQQAIGQMVVLAA
ncbi:predicted GPI-anchored protein 58 [Patiria miniata]|uniref:Uncharacterized protein n=1 Tax=Patiria miniata TaxID=46514 RepID=A0A914B707_PATMI|nr:predicted GPI-anchored protein 58 [Patiria miniata]